MYEKDRQITQISIVLHASGRASRSQLQFTPIGAAPASADGGSSAAAEFSFALKSIAQMAKTTAEVLESTCRLKPPHSDTLRLARMSMCLDLRQMARDASYAMGAENCAARKQLVLWMKKRGARG